MSKPTGARPVRTEGVAARSPRWLAIAMVCACGSPEEGAPTETINRPTTRPLTALRSGADAASKLHELALDASLGRDEAALRDDHDALAGRPDADADTRARALWEAARIAGRAGDLIGARARLDACLGLAEATSINRGACLEARATLDLEADAVRSLPTVWTFDSPEHGLAHPRAWWDQGDIALLPPNEGGGLRWTVRVDAERDDRLALAFALDDALPRVVRIEVTSEREPGALRALFEDLDGRTWLVDARDWQATADVRSRWTLDLEALFPEDGRQPLTLDRRRLHRLYVIDRTARLGTYGTHAWTLHSLAVEG